MAFVYDDLADVFGKPQIYKGINIYPVSIMDRDKFYQGLNFFTQRKNWSENPNDRKMGYLPFLLMHIGYHAHYTKDESIFDTFFDFLKFLCRDIKQIKLGVDENKQLFLWFDDIKIYNSSFNKIREIVFRQNKIEFDDNTSEDFEKNLEKARKAWEGKFGKHATFSEMIIAYRCLMHIPYDEIEQLTLFQFTQEFARLQVIKQSEVWSYPAWKAGESEKVPSWCSHIPDRKWYDHLTANLRDIEAKIKK